MFIKKVMFRKTIRSPEENVDLSRMHEERRRLRRRLKWVVLVSLVWLLFLAGLWFVFRSPVLKVREVKIEGNEMVSRSDIEGLLWAKIFRHSKLRYALGFYNMLTWPGGLTSQDLRSLPELRGIEISKDYARHEIIVRVKEKELFGIWCFLKDESRSNCGWFDPEGVLIAPAPTVEGSLIVKISDFAQMPLALHGRILPPQFIENFFSILKVLAAADLPIAEVRLENLELQEMKVLLQNGPKLFFSLRFSAMSDLTVLKNLQSDRAKPFGELQYIDFRVENRAYYK